MSTFLSFSGIYCMLGAVFEDTHELDTECPLGEIVD